MRRLPFLVQSTLSSTPQPQAHRPSISTTAHSSSHLTPAMSYNVPPSTPSLLSNASQTTLVASPSKPKNYEAAFAQLSSQYGYGGAFPIPTTNASNISSTSSKGQSKTASSTTHPLTKYEESFAQLSSSYGFSGGVPCAPSPDASKSAPSKSSKSKNQEPLNRWEQSFAQFSGRYGFAGASPSLPKRKN